MGTSLFDALADMGMLATFVLFVACLLFGALVLCGTFRVVVGYLPSYPRALAAFVLMTVAAGATVIVSGMLLPGDTYRLLPLLVGFLAGTWAVDRQLLSRDGSRIGYGKACLVQLGFMAVGFVLVMAISAILAATFGTPAVAILR